LVVFVTLFQCDNWGKMPLPKLQEPLSFLNAMENAFKLTIALTTERGRATKIPKQTTMTNVCHPKKAMSRKSESINVHPKGHFSITVFFFSIMLQSSV